MPSWAVGAGRVRHQTNDGLEPQATRGPAPPCACRAIPPNEGETLRPSVCALPLDRYARRSNPTPAGAL